MGERVDGLDIYSKLHAASCFNLKTNALLLTIWAKNTKNIFHFGHFAAFLILSPYYAGAAGRVWYHAFPYLFGFSGGIPKYATHGKFEF